MAADVGLEAGKLTIEAGYEPANVTVSYHWVFVKVESRDESGRVETKYFNGSEVRRIYFHGSYQGDDFTNNTDIENFIYGNAGVDFLQGGNGGGYIYGGTAGDTIHGGDRTDVIDGGAGTDTIFGFGGGDVIYGDGDRDATAVRKSTIFMGAPATMTSTGAKGMIRSRVKLDVTHLSTSGRCRTSRLHARRRHSRVAPVELTDYENSPASSSASRTAKLFFFADV